MEQRKILSDFYKKSLNLCDFGGLLTSSLRETGHTNGLASNNIKYLGSEPWIACRLYISETIPDDRRTNSFRPNTSHHFIM